MANIPLFTAIDDKARNDPLGPQLFNGLAMNQTALDLFHVAEHLDSGEHNAAEIARTMGRIYWDGAAYSLEGFNGYASGLTNPAVGDVQLSLNSGFTSTNMVVDALNMSETGSTKPCITTVNVVDDTTVEFFSQYLTSALGAAGNTWAAQDCNLSVGIHSLPLVANSYSTVSIPAFLTRGAFLTKTNHNNLTAANSGLRSRFLATHTSAGAHNVREVAKCHGQFTYDSGYSADADAINFGTVTTNGTGDVTVNFGSTLTSPTQVFVQVTYPRTSTYATGGGGGIYAIGCPRSTCTTTSVRIYFYAYRASTNTWDRADCDFSLSVYGA